MPATKNNKKYLKTDNKIPRPINCFMAFRLDKYKEISSQSPNLNHRDISKIIAKWWKEATEEDKAPYRKIAANAKKVHQSLFPNYKYAPQRKCERQKRPYHHKQDLLTKQKKEAENKELLRPWLGDEVDHYNKKMKKVEKVVITIDDSDQEDSNTCSFEEEEEFDDNMSSTTTTLSMNDIPKLSPTSTTVSSPSTSSNYDMHQIIMNNRNNHIPSFYSPVFSTPNNNNSSNNYNTMMMNNSYFICGSEHPLMPELCTEPTVQFNQLMWDTATEDLYLPMESSDYVNPEYLTYLPLF
ncbi:unnamed protein product [Cunninghamella blakesleeana]